ncbi:MAG: hypothetical protein QXS54_00980 [Candidatus Methanomethylicaceae archaeon]
MYNQPYYPQLNPQFNPQFNPQSSQTDDSSRDAIRRVNTTLTTAFSATLEGSITRIAYVLASLIPIVGLGAFIGAAIGTVENALVKGKNEVGRFSWGNVWLGFKVFLLVFLVLFVSNLVLTIVSFGILSDVFASLFPFFFFVAYEPILLQVVRERKARAIFKVSEWFSVLTESMGKPFLIRKIKWLLLSLLFIPVYALIAIVVAVMVAGISATNSSMESLRVVATAVAIPVLICAIPIVLFLNLFLQDWQVLYTCGYSGAPDQNIPTSTQWNYPPQSTYTSMG